MSSSRAKDDSYSLGIPFSLTPLNLGTAMKRTRYTPREDTVKSNSSM